jgi:uncharacterized protein YjbI with pentapeptide repeats
VTNVGTRNQGIAAGRKNLGYMEYESHKAILAQGVGVWNSWRDKVGVRIKPELATAKLSLKELPGVNLQEANLTKANFSKSLHQ